MMNGADAMEKIRLLALSGSLRDKSYNAAAIRALRFLVPPHIEITIGHIEALPLFNPDREHEQIPAVAALKSGLGAADGLIIASPEYAHGISGPMKNALDWLVSGEEFPYKPIMLINTSPRAHHALDALKEVLATMSGVIVESAYVSIELLSSGLDDAGIRADPHLADRLRSGLKNFYDAIAAIKRDRHED